MAEGHDGGCGWAIEPSRARQGLDVLLKLLPNREVERVDSQPPEDVLATDVQSRVVSLLTTLPSGPWVRVWFVGGAEFAILKATGAVYRVNPDGRVADDPMLELSD